MADTDQTLFLVVSLDVEEEGLFGGTYQCLRPSIRNTAQLMRLRPLLERGIRPTLFCAHAAFTDRDSCNMLAQLRDTYGAEIGAHLHHWNTPPLRSSCHPGQPRLSRPSQASFSQSSPSPDSASGPWTVPAGPRLGQPAQASHDLRGSAQPATDAPAAADPPVPEFLHSVPAAAVPLELMAAKLEQLFAAGQAFQGAPLTSFRMGRWDLHRQHWPLLADAGVLCDASVRPLHGKRTGANGIPSAPDHFAAPADPYWVPVGEKKIFEVPLSVTPLFPALPACLESLPSRWRAWGKASLKQWGALALLPVEHPLWAMKAMTRFFVQRGGRVLSLTWHSSEMMPAACPHLPDAASVDALLHRITAYVDWLRSRWDLHCVTMDELRRQAGPQAPVLRGPRSADWTTAA